MWYLWGRKSEQPASFVGVNSHPKINNTEFEDQTNRKQIHDTNNMDMTIIVKYEGGEHYKINGGIPNL